MPLDARDILYQWESYGVFDLVLPFILIFAMIFGILESTKILGKNKGVDVAISMVIALMALRIGFVQAFFTEIFPRLGVGLAILITVIILAAGFLPEDHRGAVLVGIYAIGFLIAGVVVFNSFSALNWFDSYWWDDWGATIVGIMLVIGVIVAIVVGKNKDNDPIKGAIKAFRDAT